VDEYASTVGARSRSAVIHQAIGVLRQVGLEEAYASAWEEWNATDDAALWDATSADGIIDAPR
jgi:hypothetical protein